MTRSGGASKIGSAHRLLREAGGWLDALMRRARSEGPRHTVVHGEEPAISVEASHLPGDGLTGEALIAAMQASPHRDLDLTPPRGTMTMRDIGV